MLTILRPIPYPYISMLHFIYGHIISTSYTNVVMVNFMPETKDNKNVQLVGW